jgi:nuclear pore complex protein Nup62
MSYNIQKISKTQQPKMRSFPPPRQLSKNYGKFVCMYVRICVYVCRYVCVYVCTVFCIYVCMYLCMYVCVCTYVCIYVCMHAFIYASIDVCMYVCVYVLTYARNCLFQPTRQFRLSYFPFPTEGGNAFWRFLVRDYEQCPKYFTTLIMCYHQNPVRFFERILQYQHSGAFYTDSFRMTSE